MVESKDIWCIIKRSGEQLSFFGRTAEEWLLRGIEGIRYCFDEAEQIDVRWLVTLRTDMPLVTESALIAVCEYMSRNGITAMRVGAAEFRRNDARGASQHAEPKIIANDDKFCTANFAKNYSVVYNELKQRVCDKLVRAGARICDPLTTYIDDRTTVEAGTTIYPMCYIEGECRIGADTSVGPYALIRNSSIGSGCRIGSYVEIKNSTLGNGVKCAHLAYVGDATVGDRTNVGCGAVFCNYDGAKKHRTDVGEDCFIGANVNLIAPIRLNKGAFVAAGTTVTQEVFEDEFVIGRVRQQNKPRKKKS